MLCWSETSPRRRDWSMNRADLVIAIKSYLNRPKLSAADVNTMIASCEGELNRELRDHPRNARRAEWTIPTHDDQGIELTEPTPIIPLPVDLASLQQVFTDTQVYRQYPASTPPTQIPDGAFLERGDCIHVAPTPTRGTTVYLDYIAFLRPLEAEADTNWVSMYYSDLYLYGALKEAATYLKQDQRLSLWQGEFLRRLDGVRRQGWNQNVAASPRVRARVG